MIPQVAPAQPGSPRPASIYQIAFFLPQALRVRVGRLGVVELSPGWYVYTGSGRRNLQARVARHLRGSHTTFWHIDYLRRHVAPSAWRTVECARTECEAVALAVAEGGVRTPGGFGSSDCGCGGHLVWTPDAPPWVRQP